jgi:hypothetical protein
MNMAFMAKEAGKSAERQRDTFNRILAAEAGTTG